MTTINIQLTGTPDEIRRFLTHGIHEITRHKFSDACLVAAGILETSVKNGGAEITLHGRNINVAAPGPKLFQPRTVEDEVARLATDHLTTRSTTA